MRIDLAIGMASLAAALAVPGAFGQAPTPPPAPAPPSHARTATAFFAQKETSWLGIGVVDITSERAKALKLKDEHGAEVTQVDEDSPAAKAGIKESDVVLEYNGQRVEGQEQLGRLVRETPPGRQVKIGVWRNGAAQTLTATLGAHKGMTMDGGDWAYTVKIPPIPPMPVIEFPQIQTIWQSVTLGIVGEPLERQPQLAEFFGVKDGVLVKSVTRNSAADKAGIKAGDVIVKVDDNNISSTRDISSALRQLRAKRTFPVTVVRNHKEMALTLTLESMGMRDHAAAAESHC